jgi:hypothetical protein
MGQRVNSIDGGLVKIFSTRAKTGPAVESFCVKLRKVFYRVRRPNVCFGPAGLVTDLCFGNAKRQLTLHRGLAQTAASEFLPADLNGPEGNDAHAPKTAPCRGTFTIHCDPGMTVSRRLGYDPFGFLNQKSKRRTNADCEQEQYVVRRPVLRLPEQVRRRSNKRAEHIF